MSSKTLSTSTLSLRFMQNAHRAKLLKEVELEKATVHDDAQWDVGQEVREAWGLVSEQDSSQVVNHEASFLPFLFSDTPDAATEPNPMSKIPNGRRKFNNSTQEESIEEKPEPEEQDPEPLPEPQQQLSKPPPSKDKKRRSRLHPNPVPIQSISEKLIKGLPVLTKPKESKSARDAVFDNSGVGTDLRASSSAKSKVAISGISANQGFLKPSGVEAPPEKSKIKRSDLIDGARAKKPKRSREGSEDKDSSEAKEKKRLKKK